MDRRIKKLGIVLVGILGFTFIGRMPLQAASPIWAPEALEQLIQEGLTRNRELKSLEAKVASAREQIPLAGSLEDPRLGIGVLNLPTDTFSSGQEPMTQKQIFLSQKIPWFGKLTLKEQRQTLAAVRQEILLEGKRMEIAREIAEAYYELGFTLVNSEINTRLKEMLDQIIRITETRYASGSGLQQDVLQAQVELSKLLEEKISLRSRRRILEDKINGLLNREAFEPITPSDDIRFLDLPLDLKALQERTLRQNPRIRVKRLEAEIGTLEVQIARTDYWPDMNFTLAYGQREDDPLGRERADFLSATVAFNLPLWKKSRQDRTLAAMQRNAEALRESYQGLFHTLPHRVDALVTEITDLQENYRLFSEALMLQADHSARSSLSSYVVGKVEFNTMINTQIRLLRFELQSKKYLYSIYQKRAELEELLGGPP